MNLVKHYIFSEGGKSTTPRLFETNDSIITFLKMKFSSGSMFGTNELLRSGHYKEAGINYDFTPWLKRFLVEDKFDNLFSRWAPSKTSLRKAAYLTRGHRIYFFPKK